MNVEALGGAHLETEQLRVEAWRVGFRPELDADVGVRVGRALAVAALQIQHRRVAIVDTAPFHRLVTRGAIAQALQRAVHRRVVDRDRRALEGNCGEVAGVERRHRVERRGERQRLTFFNRDVADIRCVHRLHPLLAQRVVDGTRDEVVGDVMEDLILEALLDHTRGRLAGAESRNARLP